MVVVVVVVVELVVEKEDVVRLQLPTNYQKVNAKKAGVQVGGCLPGPPEMKNRVLVRYL